MKDFIEKRRKELEESKQFYLNKLEALYQEIEKTKTNINGVEGALINNNEILNEWVRRDKAEEEAKRLADPNLDSGDDVK